MKYATKGARVDTSVIDELYSVYQSEKIFNAVDYFTKKKKIMEIKGDYSLIPTIQAYIKSQSEIVANYFISNKDDELQEFRVVKDVVAVFDYLIMVVDYYLTDYLYGDDTENHVDEYCEYFEEVRAQDLFTINFSFLDKAFELYGTIDKECYENVKKLIAYIRKNKILGKLYTDKNWREINFEELIYVLYDKIEDKNLFKSINPTLPEDEFLFFDNLKQNCSHISSISFDKYRPQLNCNKQMQANFGKLIFCNNLLIYYQSGIMPDKEGRLDCVVSEFEQTVLLDEFKTLYSKDFDVNEFRNKQGNYICDPSIVRNDFSIEAAKKVRQGDQLIIGFLISSSYGYNKINYLLHMDISDVNNDCSNYEIQFNLIPQGYLSERLQLIRLDNWESEQPHRNVAKKLATTTHIHLYNEFDLLRGKVNGNFDIAYNLEGTSTAFETSLKTFLKILDLDSDVSKRIYDATIKSVETSKKHEKTIEPKISD